MTEQEVMGTNWNMGGCSWTWGNIFFTVRVTKCRDRLSREIASLHPCRYSKSIRILSEVTSSMCPCSSMGGWSKWSLEVSSILNHSVLLWNRAANWWFFESLNTVCGAGLVPHYEMRAILGIHLNLSIRRLETQGK